MKNKREINDVNQSLYFPTKIEDPYDICWVLRNISGKSQVILDVTSQSCSKRNDDDELMLAAKS